MAATLTTDDVSQALLPLLDPNTHQGLLTTRSARNIRVETVPGEAQQYHISVDVVLGYPALGDTAVVRAMVSQALQALPGAARLSINVYSKVTAHAVQSGLSPIQAIKNIIAVSSAKGGVGKSTLAANLALALAQSGAAVGILDADIYGPSQPLLFGLMDDRPPAPVAGETRIPPLYGQGIPISSIGFLIDPHSPIIWRGPMVTRALEQLFRQTQWGSLDYLVVDMPPGTGDIHLTLAQKIPVTGAVVVTTPQDLALLDARRGLHMFQKTGITVLGIVENMAGHTCKKCGNVDPVFGQGGGERLSAEMGVDFLGSIPLDMGIRAQADAGRLTVAAEPRSVSADLYRKIAHRLSVKIAQKPRASLPIVSEKG